MPSRFLKELDRRVLVFDGAMGTSIHQIPLSVEKDYCGCENCTEILVQSRPDVIQSIHESFLAAGADAVETDTFGANKLVLAEFGIADKTYALAKGAAELARAACDKFSTSDKPRFVAGSFGPGTKLITLGQASWEIMLDSYREEARGLLDGGVDALLIETCQDLLQVKCAINACLAALAERNKTPLDVPIMVSVTIETNGKMLMGSEIAAVATALSGYPIASLGLNCATGPTEMTEHVQWLGRHWGGIGSAGPRRISIMPNAGLPIMVGGHAEFPLRPQPFAEAMLRFIEESGVNMVGGCCGTTPEHIKLLAQAVGHRPAYQVAKQPFDPGCASLYSPVEYRQDNSYLIVGERMNASGSRAFKKLLEAEDWDGIVSLARDQVRHDGAHVLDLNVDYAGRDNVRDMTEVVHRVVRQVDVPLMIDSTQLATIEAGLKHAPGKCIINSGNFEDGEEKFARICALARTYGAALVCGTIDEDQQESMARTADRKLSIAERLYDVAVNQHGLAPEDILFDPLVLPISTGMEKDRRSALETIEGTRRIMEKFPRSQTTCGLSNVSFGLNPAARVVLNSVFLHELREAGLTSAIVHASKILPRNKIPDEQWNAALEVIYDRRRKGFDPLQAFIGLFADAGEAAANAKKKEARTFTLEERLRTHIVDGEKRNLIETLEEARQKYTPLVIINEHLLDGMKTVGELFGSGQMQLPFVLQSAEVMKMAVGHLETFMEKVAGQTKGSIVLATVKGDVHDIGKNLVDIILSNNGFTVYNLGIKQPIGDIVKAWREKKADAIGLSGLLVKSVNVMEENLQELNSEGIAVPVLLGGAALTRHYCESHLRSIYKGQGGVFYGRDAFDGLRIMDSLVAGRGHELVTEIQNRIAKRQVSEDTVRAAQERRQTQAASEGGGGVAVAVRSDVKTDAPVPAAPFFGSRVVEGIDLDTIYAYINKVALYRGQWQFKKGAKSDEEYEASLSDTADKVFDRLSKACKVEGILQPKVVYGYYPVNSDGDDLVVYDAVDQDREVERFHFPRQAGRQRLCISDFFRPVSLGQKDVLGLHCVTMGARVSVAAKALFEKNEYTEYLYLHGFGVECAEALAELWHKRMRQELGIAGEDSPKIRELFTQHYRGSRYSFGYPACPDMADQEKLFRLLKPERIGCILTENWQIDPEQSTSAIIVHHPQAKYFNV
jgi:5-methyltetrahydrofolate--homocysteine methyltransferase